MNDNIIATIVLGALLLLGHIDILKLSNRLKTYLPAEELANICTRKPQNMELRF